MYAHSRDEQTEIHANGHEAWTLNTLNGNDANIDADNGNDNDGDTDDKRSRKNEKYANIH